MIFFIVIILGLCLELAVFFLLEKIIGKPFKTHHNKYSFGRHVSLMSIPIWGLIALVITGHFNYVQLFLLGAFVGTVAEYCFGRFFHHIEGQKIWTYKYWTLAGYTSIFSVPYWGGATLLFVLLAKLLEI